MKQVSSSQLSFDIDYGNCVIYTPIGTTLGWNSKCDPKEAGKRDRRSAECTECTDLMRNIQIDARCQLGCHNRSDRSSLRLSRMESGKHTLEAIHDIQMHNRRENRTRSEKSRDVS